MPYRFRPGAVIDRSPSVIGETINLMIWAASLSPRILSMTPRDNRERRASPESRDKKL